MQNVIWIQKRHAWNGEKKRKLTMGRSYLNIICSRMPRTRRCLWAISVLISKPINQSANQSIKPTTSPFAASPSTYYIYLPQPTHALWTTIDCETYINRCIQMHWFAPNTISYRHQHYHQQSRSMGAWALKQATIVKTSFYHVSSIQRSRIQWTAITMIHWIPISHTHDILL